MVALEVAYGLVDQTDLFGKRHRPPGAGGVGPAEGRAAVNAPQSHLSDGRGMARPIGDVGGSGGEYLNLRPDQAQRGDSHLGSSAGSPRRRRGGSPPPSSFCWHDDVLSALCRSSAC